MIGATGFTVAEIAVGASELSLAGDVSEFSTAAERAAVGCAGVTTGVETSLGLDSFFFSTGLLVSNGAVDFGASSDFLVSAFSSFLVSAGTSLSSEAADFSIPSAFSVDGAGASEVVAELERSTFGAGAPSPYALEATGTSA